ncbi:MAG: haloalkane dehalogenase [Gammaproteobacteria bacterium]|nr:haloalkane dehalogenase [Gammaproteobacteria bacterium]MBQ0773633.1 haloalkane dehalogenase [Gammaproteobacteria bacterium]
MKALRTPDECFAHLTDYPYAPHYLNVDDSEGAQLRLHFIDEGPRNARTLLLMHGEPSWSYLYRKMIGPLVAAGFRVIAPDLIGFGKSDKPVAREDYTYARHVMWMQSFVDQLDLQNTVLFCQDWGGLIGLRLVAANSDRFAAVLAGNTMLPTGDHHPGDAFLAWQTFSQETPIFPVGKVIQTGLATPISADVIAAYDAPFPSEDYKAGARQFPLLVPITPDDPEAPANRQAWQALQQFEKPFLTCFSDKDPVTRGGDKVMQKLIPGCAGQDHTLIENGGHFLQEDQGEKLAEVMLTFLRKNTLNNKV